MSELFDLDDEPDSIEEWELAPAITALLRQPFLTENTDPAAYRVARLHEDELRQWFDRTTGWRVKVSELGRHVRLFKRSHVPVDDRFCLFTSAEPPSALLLTLLCLVCEQLWRRPEITYNDLLREVIQSCAVESGRGQLPQFRPVTEAGEPRVVADMHRRAFKNALLILERLEIITTDRPISRGQEDFDASLIITCDPERLNDLLAEPVAQLSIELTEPDTHIAALCADQQDLPDHSSDTQREQQRRHRALRSVIDNPTVSLTADEETTRYLTSPGGRRQALDAAYAAQLVCVVRRDVWLSLDPSGRKSSLDFPSQRTHSSQAALMILAELRDLPHSTAITADDAQTALAQGMALNPQWATSSRTGTGLRTLTTTALATLVAAGLLEPSEGDNASWRFTPVARYWRVRVTADIERTTSPPPSDTLFDVQGDIHEQEAN